MRGRSLESREVPLRQATQLPLTAVAALLLLLAATGQAAGEPGAKGRLRVLCYNIHHGRGTDGDVDLERTARVIRDADPDLVALQEVDRKTARAGGVDQTARLAELTGLQGRFGCQIDFEGGEYGQALLSRFPMSEVTVYWLPGEPKRQRRIAVAAVVETPRGPLRFVSTHLHHQNADFRQRQAVELNRLFQSDPIPTILAGDLNALPGTRPLLILSRSWQSATGKRADRFTFSAENPSRQIDFVLYRPASRFHVISSEVPEEPAASDHRPLLVELEW
ncbi:hypothetical protein Mal4_23500 [Maioricimonas rarisocia]|uniref:Endonuclease/exonuclease/phosphatase domain-containing protein n=1 Tax=Maioricimonas rarisocia TaxID=2528026 RepID=A0A517Z6B0_9PLAN|nr:endonuclease/exonuclease/phosphatase family protein [Maioricimonas rarisocia]QDU38030.1 hypothetical protein Mal4_23500 [Maioricimonas rarisocia]